MFIFFFAFSAYAQCNIGGEDYIYFTNLINKFRRTSLCFGKKRKEMLYEHKNKKQIFNERTYTAHSNGYDVRYDFRWQCDGFGSSR